LGQKKAHHAAHKPEALCILTAPETVLHLNTKAYLHAQLSRARQLYVYQRCYGWWAPAVRTVRGHHVECSWRGGRRPYLWLDGWDSIELEQRVGSRRPDIVFYRSREPVAAIEVKATHAVDDEKRVDLERSGLPWIEVVASEEIYAGDRPWSSDRPLAFSECSPELPYWTCENCLKREGRYEEDVLKSLAQEEELRRKIAEEVRQRREHREAHERWLKEEIVPRSFPVRPAAPPTIFWTWTVSDESGQELAYVVKQATEHSEVFLRFGDQILAAIPPPYTAAAAKHLSRIFRDHRSNLGDGFRDVTKWVKGSTK
jgi:hypothetical protein